MVITKLNFQDWINKANHKSFSSLGAKIWNCIPPSIRNLPKQSFKLYIHDCFKSFHEHTNNYPVLPTLLGQMQRIQNRP